MQLAAADVAPHDSFAVATWPTGEPGVLGVVGPWPRPGLGYREVGAGPRRPARSSCQGPALAHARVRSVGLEARFPGPHYDFTRSTIDNYRERRSPGLLIGDFAATRAQLDYTYHTNVRPARQRWQDGVVRELLRVGSSARANCGRRRPWCVFTCGAMGAGKSFVRRWCAEREEHFPWRDTAIIDPDYIKKRMPEWRGYLAVSRVAAGSLCHQESMLIQELAHEEALRRGRDVCVDGSLRDVGWTFSMIGRIRRRYPRYRIAIIFVHADERTAFARCQRRAREEGRVVPYERFLRSCGVDDRARRFSPLVDRVLHFDNSRDDRAPVLVHERGSLSRKAG